LFHARFFNWIGQGIVQLRPERPPFQELQAPSIHVPPHVSLQPEVPENDGMQEIVHPIVSQHHGWPKLTFPSPPTLNPISQDAPNHSPMQSSHARKRLKTKAHYAPSKGKVFVAPSSPSDDSGKSVSSQIHLRDDFSHVISEINPKGSSQLKAFLRKSGGDNRNQGKVAS